MKKPVIIGLALGAIGAVLLSGKKKEDFKNIKVDIGEATIEPSVRGRIVQIAANEIGEQNPDKYWSVCLNTPPPYPINWCGGFVLWVLESAGLPRMSEWEIGTKLIPTTDPLPGDVAWIDLGKSTGPTDTRGHKAIIESVNGDNITTIDGNQESNAKVAPHYVRRVTRLRSKFSGFFSIDPLIDHANV